MASEDKARAAVKDFLVEVTQSQLLTAPGLQPLRRDLQELSDRGLLRRHHGGASANLSTVNADYDLRHVETAQEKAAIGRAAAELVKPGSSIFLTPGTTIDALAKGACGWNRTIGFHSARRPAQP